MSKELIYKESALDILDDFQSDKENSVPNAYTMARQRMLGLCPSNPHDITYINALKNRIKELEADKPQGEWIRMRFVDCGSPIDKCSKCGHYINGDVEVRNYCPNCGAHMKGADDE